MDVFKKPVFVDANINENLGPLAALAGVWLGDHGMDTAPSAKGPVETKFRERITLDPIGPMINGPQVLYGLKYTTVAWPLTDDDPFHEEGGYWLWDSETQLIMRCFIVPRGVMINAGGYSDPNAKILQMSAEIGTETFGIMSSPFLNKAFKTVRYYLKVEILDESKFSYFEDTQIKIHGQEMLFHHTDQNTLIRQ